MPLPTRASLAEHNKDDAELLYGRSATLRVFISSEMRTGRLRPARLAAAAIVDKHPDAEAWLWERNARPGRYSAFDVCVGTAGTSDILLLILGADLTDVTEAEWRAAKAGGANCALLVKETGRRTPRAEAFVAAERSECIYAGYSDLRGLRRAVRATLTQCMTDAVRHRALARRARDAGRDSPGIHLFEAGLERAHEFYRLGAIEQAAEVLDEIDTVTSAQPHEDLDLITGLVAGARGHVSSAASAYLRIIRNGRSSPSAKALAYQNLGIEAMRAGDLRAAAAYMNAALRRHRALDDWFGILQVLINMGNLALERGDTYTTAAAVDAASQLAPHFEPDVPAQQASLTVLRAGIAAHQGHHPDALAGYKAAYAAFRRLDDVEGQIVGCQNVAGAYRELGRLLLARRWISKALTLAAAQGPVWRREEVHRSAALIALDLGDLPEAQQQFESARALATRMGDSWRVATLTADIGAVLASMDADDAAEELERANALLIEEQAFDWMARVGMTRAEIARRRGDAAAATSILTEVTCLGQADRRLRVQAFEQLARLQLEDGRGGDAARSLKKALAHQPPSPASALAAAQYAGELQSAGQHGHALRLFDMALTRAQRGDDVGLVCDVRSDRALLLAAKGDEQGALAELEGCLQTARTLRDPERTVRALHNIGEVARRLGDNRRALSALRTACTFATKTGDDEAVRGTMGLLAMAQFDAGRLDDAATTATTLREDARSARDRLNESVALGVLGSCAFAKADYVRASELFRAAARRNTDDGVRHAGDLGGVLESHAAAGRWRPTVRAAQTLVDHAQGQQCEGAAWNSLIRAARWYLDRGQPDRAGALTAPAWVLAVHTVATRPRKQRRSATDGSLDIWQSELMDAVLLSAFHELWTTSTPCDALCDAALQHLDITPPAATQLRALIADARATARDFEERATR